MPSKTMFRAFNSAGPEYLAYTQGVEGPNPSRPTTCGRMAQLVKAPRSHRGEPWFDPRCAHLLVALFLLVSCASTGPVFEYRGRLVDHVPCENKHSIIILDNGKVLTVTKSFIPRGSDSIFVSGNKLISKSFKDTFEIVSSCAEVSQ